MLAPPGTAEEDLDIQSGLQHPGSKDRLPIRSQRDPGAGWGEPGMYITLALWQPSALIPGEARNPGGNFLKGLQRKEQFLKYQRRTHPAPYS